MCGVWTGDVTDDEGGTDRCCYLQVLERMKGFSVKQVLTCLVCGVETDVTGVFRGCSNIT